MNNRPYESYEGFIAGISLEMNLDLTVFERKTYSLLDAFADIGGLTKLLNSTLSFIVVIFNFSRIESYLAANLFKIKKSEDELITPTRCNSIKVLLVSLLPKKLLCRHCKY